jgi:hypothetical protein
MFLGGFHALPGYLIVVPRAGFHMSLEALAECVFVFLSGSAIGSVPMGCALFFLAASKSYSQ